MLLFLVVTLALTLPAEAQLRQAPTQEQNRVKLYDAGSGLSLNRFFDPAHFRMSHSLEFSTGSFGGGASSLGMYTNSMQWQFSQKLAARVDVALAYSPTGNINGSNSFNGGNNSGKVFLRNAEIAYRPSENTMLHLSIRNSPYGSYMSPYGGYNPGYGYNRDAMFYGDPVARLFWK